MARHDGRWALLAMAWAAACTDGGASPPTDASTTDAPADATANPVDPSDCDPLDEHACALPWPSNLYLRPDSTRPTGYALRFGRTSFPANRQGTFLDGSTLAHLDGYGVGTPILAVFPGVDVSRMATEESLPRSLEPDSPTLLFEVEGTTLRRVPHWVELDAQDPDNRARTLFLRPAVILKEATRYVVAFRDLRTTEGTPIAPSAPFRALRDGQAASDPRLAPRRARFDETFTLLEAAGVARSSLTLAWDFHTASSAALHGRMLALRDDALTRVGPTGPALRVDTTRTFTPAENATIALELDGTMDAPDYTSIRTFTGNSTEFRPLRLDAQGRPAAEGTAPVRFLVRVPRSALDGTPHGIVVYGHGLLGSLEEVRASHLGALANTHHFILVAASFDGMAEGDFASVFASLQDLSRFSAVVGRQHQGVAQWVLLARAARERLGALPELTSRNVRVNREELYYSGNSQGGIFGGTFLAVTPDIVRGHLGVPGNNYATLLHRSSDFGGFFLLLRQTYPSTVDQALALGYVQLHWESVDPVSYYRHLSAQPFAGNAPHHVLVGPARGDYQVSVMTNEVAARSDLGLALMEHYDRDRTPWGCTQAAYPRRGSGVVLYNFGNPWPRPGNLPPTRDSLGDPHERPRRHEGHQRQIATFFRTGEIIDVCGGDGCNPD